MTAPNRPAIRISEGRKTMEGWKIAQGSLLTTLIAAAWLALAAPVHAEETRGDRRSEAKELLKALESEWRAMREDLTRCALESMMTAFFIRSGTAPTTPPNIQPSQSPPQQEVGPPPPPPPPPPPTGQGELPPTPPPIEPPPQGAPEPASIVSALLGVGLTSWYAWRRRRVC